MWLYLLTKQIKEGNSEVTIQMQITTTVLIVHMAVIRLNAGAIVLNCPVYRDPEF